jgi:hypothetical protein
MLEKLSNREFSPKNRAAHGLNLYQIGMLLYKPGFEEEVNSEVENLIEKTEKICSLYSNRKFVLT